MAELSSVTAKTFTILQVLLHDSNEVPMMLERAFLISPGFVTRIAVTAQYVSNKNYFKQECRKNPTTRPMLGTEFSQMWGKVRPYGGRH